MKHSTDRFLVTHVGSLPRPQRLMDLMRAEQEGRSADAAGYPTFLKDSVAEVVRKQVELGIDIVDDGEFGKPSFLTYVNQRLGGFETGKPRGSPWAGSREVQAFPEYYEWAARTSTNPSGTVNRMICTGPVTYKGRQLLERDIANLRAALGGSGALEAFLPAISPSNVEDWQVNQYYKSEEEFLFAIAEAMREEYKAIVDAGFLLQVDDPRLATYYTLNPGKSLEECRAWAEVRVEALNHALRGIPEDRVRFHTCYSINMGPRVHEMELKNIVDLILKVRAGAYSFEASNPRHEHEWRVWQNVKLPEGKVLIPGFITQSSVLVEHPALVSERILRFVSVVGRERLIAGADCGFASFAGNMEIHPSIVWAKLQSLAEGARLASREAWGRSAAGA
jgi:5-methyltetrahydropteroyltriglutamate--homocysteine methyltransferase